MIAHPPRFYVSPCGNCLDCADIGPIPSSWTDVTGMSDFAISQMMERRWWASSK